MAFDVEPLEAPDGHRIAVRYAPADGTPRGLVQVLHGLAEHSARYARLATALNAAGWSVIAHDHRGHGESIAREADVGHFGDLDGWRRVIEDVRAVRALGRARCPEGKLALFGHSMGSFIATSEQLDAPGGVDLLVLSGGNAGGGLLERVGLRIAKLERWRAGPRGRSALLEKMSFGSFNGAFRPNRTEFDWLSRDPREVDAYVNDPRCGFRCTNQLWVDLVGALIELGDDARVGRLPRDLPVYAFCGSRDPVSKGGSGVEAFAAQLRRVGVRSVDVKIYPDARHETLNETNRDEVMADLAAWLAGTDSARTLTRAARAR